MSQLVLDQNAFRDTTTLTHFISVLSSPVPDLAAALARTGSALPRTSLARLTLRECRSNKPSRSSKSRECNLDTRALTRVNNVNVGGQ